jgi:hypothetical protein
MTPKICTHRIALPLALLALLVPAGLAQGFNVDVVMGFGTPANSYGGAAGQTGTWNGLPAQSGFAALSDVDGNVTGATLTGIDLFELAFNNAGTSGDDEKLMDDFLDGDATYVFDGLANGDYEVYTYAWAPDQASFTSSVSVFSSPDPVQNVGGSWPGSHALGTTYAKHTVTVVDGSITIDVAASVGFSSTNGFQIVPVVAPPCRSVESFCTAKINSCGGSPQVGASGTPSASSTSGFFVTSDEVRGPKCNGAKTTGILIYTNTGRRVPALNFGGGFLCLNPPVRRTGSIEAVGGTTNVCDAIFSIDMSAFAHGLVGGNPQGYLQVPGTTVALQIWGRDTFAHGNYLSDAIDYVLCP